MTKPTRKAFFKGKLHALASAFLLLFLFSSFLTFGQKSKKEPSLSHQIALSTTSVPSDQCLSAHKSVILNENNPFFVINCIDQYPNNYLQVYNRWGTKVYAMNGYDNTWDGDSTGLSARGAQKKLPVGTYYYTLNLGTKKNIQKAGWLYITK